MEIYFEYEKKKVTKVSIKKEAKKITKEELEKEVVYQRDGWGKAVIELGKTLGKLDEAKSIIKGLLIYIKHSCDVSYSNAIHEAEDFIGGKI